MLFYQKIINNNRLLLKEHVEKILKSGLLLDEDLEKVLDIYENNFDQPAVINETINVKYVTVASCLIVPFLYILTNFNTFLMTSFVVLSSIVVLLVYLTYLKQKLRRDFDTIIRNLSQIYKITVAIGKYMKKRDDVAKLKLNPPIATIRSDFINLVHNQKQTHVQLLDECIKFVYKHLQELPNAQPQLANIDDNLPLICSIKNQQTDGIEDALKFEETLKDVSILVTSLFLHCLSYLLGSLIKHNANLFIFNYRMSRIAQISIKYVDALQNKFDKIQYKYIIKGQPHSKDIVDVFNRNNIREAGKQSIKAASLLFETVNDFYDKLQNLHDDNQADREIINSYFENLRQDAYEYYKSVDIWCNIYSTSIKNQQIKNAEINDDHNVDDEPQSGNVENPLDTIEDVEDLINAMNEEYYVGEGNEEAMKFEDSIDEMDKLKQFKMLYMELKHKLKTNRRFKEAQQRRGIEDTSAHQGENQEEVIPPPPSPLIPTLATPPPPPLPPVFGHQDDERNVNDRFLNPSISDRNIRDAVMAVIKRQTNSREEDTFVHEPEESFSD